MAKTRKQRKQSIVVVPPTYLHKNKESDFINDYIKSGTSFRIPNDIETRFIKDIQTVYDKPKKFIPVGTRLYRTGFEVDPTQFFESDILFFGLDTYIAIWYALELWQRVRTDRYSIPLDKWKVPLHEYKVIKPISYNYMPDIDINPKNDEYFEICKKGPCVHPQIILHGKNYNVIKEIGTEITFPNSNTYPILTHIAPFQSYMIDIFQLLENQNKLSLSIDWTTIIKSI